MACASGKSPWLTCAEHLNAWVEHTERSGSDMAREFSRGGVVYDFPTLVRIVNWAYRQTFDGHGLTWVRTDELQTLPPDWNQTLKRLLN